MTRDLLLAAWVSGFQAQRAGLRLNQNPHPQDEASHWRWRLGWSAALDTRGAVEAEPTGADFAASAAAVAADSEAREIAEDLGERVYPETSRKARKARRKLQRRRLLAGLIPGLACLAVGAAAAGIHLAGRPDVAREAAQDVTTTLALPI